MTDPDPIAGLDARGRALWDAMAGVDMGPAHRALLVEACRIVDRLDGLDRLLDEKPWTGGEVDDDGRVEVVVDAVLAEARQYAAALKVIVAQLEPKPKAAAASTPTPKGGGAGLADLTARIAARRVSGASG